jgi:hypothetical protein
MPASSLLTPELAEQLRANARLREPNPVPVVKLFNPVGAGTWLATELDEDGDTLFGLADLGMGFPELGSFSLAELQALRLPFGLAIERDLSFSTSFALAVWAETARSAGSLMAAEQILATAHACGGP